MYLHGIERSPVELLNKFSSTRSFSELNYDHSAIGRRISDQPKMCHTFGSWSNEREEI